MAILLFIIPPQQVILSDYDPLGLEIHHEGLTAQQLGPNEDVLRLGCYAVNRSPFTVEANLAKINFLFDHGTRSNLKFFSTDGEPFAVGQQASWNTQIAIKARVNYSGMLDGTAAQDQLN